MKFIIVSPRQHSGGSIVLHRLCQYLQDQGHEASVFLICRGCFSSKRTFLSWFIWLCYNIADFVAYHVFKLLAGIGFVAPFENFFYSPIKNIKRWYGFKVPSDVIVVYPEIVYGNPLHAQKVVRWLLYFNKFHDDKAFGNKDLVFCYRDIFNDSQLNPKGRRLGFSYFDFGMYKQTNFAERQGVCYILRKGKNRKDLPSTFIGPIIDNLSECRKVKILNRCEYCYLYDTQTFYGTIAAVCGAIPIVVLEKGKTRNDYLGNGETGYGVAYGDTESEVDFAIKTRNLCLEDLKKLEIYGEQQVIEFIKTCEDYFKGVKDDTERKSKQFI